MKKFHISDILSVTTGYLVSTRHIDGVYDILDYMSGESLFTHALVRVSKEVAPLLIAMYPWSDQEEAWAGLTPDQVLADTKRLEAEHGAMHAIHPMHPDDHESKDPVQELEDMGFKGDVIRFDISDQEPTPSPYGDITWKDD